MDDCPMTWGLCGGVGTVADPVHPHRCEQQAGTGHPPEHRCGACGDLRTVSDRD